MAFVATGVFDGNLAKPVLTLNGLGDAISAPAFQFFYEEAVRRTGKGSMLRQVYTDSAGHCGFIAAETVASGHTLMHRVDTGRWPETTAAAMQRAVEKTKLANARSVDYLPPRFLRSYDSCQLQRDLQHANTEPVRLPGQALPVCMRPKANDIANVPVRTGTTTAPEIQR